jgi:hypothetical protein
MCPKVGHLLGPRTYFPTDLEALYVPMRKISGHAKRAGSAQPLAPTCAVRSEGEFRLAMTSKLLVATHIPIKMLFRGKALI